jgi:hypothetical protein
VRGGSVVSGSGSLSVPVIVRRLGPLVPGPTIVPGLTIFRSLVPVILGIIPGPTVVVYKGATTEGG